MANQTMSGSGYGSNWGWWIVAIIAAVLITWWIAYAAYHNSGYYGNSYNQGAVTSGAPTAGGNASTGTNR